MGSMMTDNRFSRTALVLGPNAMDVLAQARVAVFGIGGVGGFAVEALVRSGIGAIDIVDADSVSNTNLNRQLIATEDTVDHDKVEVMAARIASISPSCKVSARKVFYLPSTCDEFDFNDYDYVIDAVDTVTAKLQLIKEAGDHNTPIISCMGTGNKLDPTKLQVANIEDTTVCPLAKVIRKESRKRGLGSFKVVFSTEEARTPIVDPNDSNPEQPPEGRRSIPGSFAPVPATAGLIIAAEVIRDITGV